MYQHLQDFICIKRQTPIQLISILIQKSMSKYYNNKERQIACRIEKIANLLTNKSDICKEFQLH